MFGLVALRPLLHLPSVFLLYSKSICWAAGFVLYWPDKGLIHLATIGSVPARWPEPNAGVARHVGGSIFGS